MTAAAWRKSSWSTFNGSCAEVAASGAGVLVRDSKLAGRSPVLRFGAAQWAVFLASLKQRQDRGQT